MQHLITFIVYRDSIATILLNVERVIFTTFTIIGAAYE